MPVEHDLVNYACMLTWHMGTSMLFCAHMAWGISVPLCFNNWLSFVVVLGVLVHGAGVHKYLCAQA